MSDGDEFLLKPFLPSHFEVMGPLFICRGAAPVAPFTAAPAGTVPGTATATTAPAHWCDLLKSKCQGKNLLKSQGKWSSILNPRL